MIRHFARVAAAVLGVCACATPTATTGPARAAAPTAVQLSTVLILQSQDTPIYRAALKGFEQALGLSTTCLLVDQNTDVDVVTAALRQSHAALILALGSRAALLARQATAEIPIVFALVLGHTRLHLGEQDNVMGVAMENPALSEFTKFKIIMPNLKKVLCLYTRGLSEMQMQKAQEELHGVGIELVAVAVGDGHEVLPKFKESWAGVDALWLPNDPVLKEFLDLKKAAMTARLPILTSLSDAFAHAGALMSVSVDLGAIGAQAAGMARLVLQHSSLPHTLGVQYPNGARLVVNTTTAELLGVDVSLDLLPFIDEIVEADSLAQKP